MTIVKTIIRNGTRQDAMSLAELINIAGEGLPVYLWQKMAEPGESVWDVGCRRALREEGGFSYLNAVCTVSGKTIAASMIGYPLAKVPEPIEPEETPDMFVPLLELENSAPDTWYVNVLATYPAYRNQGLGTELLNYAQQQAKDTQKRGLSLIVADANQSARRLYQSFGFSEVASKPMVKENWSNDSENWILMVK